MRTAVAAANVDMAIKQDRDLLDRAPTTKDRRRGEGRGTGAAEGVNECDGDEIATSRMAMPVRTLLCVTSSRKTS